MKKFMWFQPMQFNFAAAPVIPSGDTGGAGTGSGGAGSPGAGGGGTPAPAGTGAPAAPQINWESAPQQLREGYNKLKADHEALQQKYKPWESVTAKPDEIGRFQQNYQQIHSELTSIAGTLQIDEAEVADAIRVHGLLPVLDQLRYEAQQAEAAAGGDQAVIQQQELEDRINQGIETRLSPVLQRENQRLVHEGNALVERTITELATGAFKTAGLDFVAAPPALKDFILTGVTEALKYDDDGMKALKFEGKTAPIQKAFQTFQAMWDAAYLARRQMESGAPIVRPGAPQARQQVPGKLPSIDEIINDPNTVRVAQNKPAYST